MFPTPRCKFGRTHPRTGRPPQVKFGSSHVRFGRPGPPARNASGHGIGTKARNRRKPWKRRRSWDRRRSRDRQIMVLSHDMQVMALAQAMTSAHVGASNGITRPERARTYVSRALVRLPPGMRDALRLCGFLPRSVPGFEPRAHARGSARCNTAPAVRRTRGHAARTTRTAVRVDRYGRCMPAHAMASAQPIGLAHVTGPVRAMTSAQATAPAQAVALAHATVSAQAVVSAHATVSAGPVRVMGSYEVGPAHGRYAGQPHWRTTPLATKLGRRTPCRSPW